MPERARDPVFRVRFDAVTFQEDLRNARAAGRAIGAQAREQLERDGVFVSLLSPCQVDARDGTDLPGMVKLYLPIPYGPWGLVLAGDRDQDGPFLLAVAFGERHPQRRPSVYDIAHHRQHGTWPAGMRADAGA
jgi:hypothetical protein